MPTVVAHAKTQVLGSWQTCFELGSPDLTLGV